ncbi:bacillithiol biosynthesis deacetylase BshB1 [Cnuella takakiae]|uniref:Bacillithiol biosynthesis deacetylase BshB1 n=2 Tax=Cnuella takakiae TaxID=1302690 RepID=A0A1M5HJ89_9BACT|nr:bacillithiol biosynthesis deacetylase BshB1 [Cnuella takakiae]
MPGHNGRMKLDLLAIGVHPDDVELGCSGVLIKERMRGKKVGIVDLTEGELGTRGTVETRYAEAAEAGRIIGVSARENLRMRDGFFRNDEEHQMKLIAALRKYQPDIVIGNVLEDRHPDHGRAGHLIYDACFLSGLRQVKTYDDAGNEQEKWRPKYLLHYIQDRFYEPDVIVDISDVWEERLQSILAYRTQFHDPNSSEPQTYISSPEFLDAITARARMLGKRIGVRFAEGFLSKKNIGISNLDALVLQET